MVFGIKIWPEPPISEGTDPDGHGLLPVYCAPVPCHFELGHPQSWVIILPSRFPVRFGWGKSSLESHTKPCPLITLAAFELALEIMGLKQHSETGQMRHTSYDSATSDSL